MIFKFESQKYYNFNDQMSYQHRRNTKSLNKKITELENMGTMQETMFHNSVLLDIHNLQTKRQKGIGLKNKRCQACSSHHKKTCQSLDRSFTSKRQSANNTMRIEKKKKVAKQKVSQEQKQKIQTIQYQQQIEQLNAKLHEERQEKAFLKLEYEEKKVEDLQTIKKYQREIQSSKKEIQREKRIIQSMKQGICEEQTSKAKLLNQVEKFHHQKQSLVIQIRTLEEERNQKQKIQKQLQKTLSQLEHKLNQSIESLSNQKNLLKHQKSQMEEKLEEYLTKISYIESEYEVLDIKYTRILEENLKLREQKQSIEEENRQNKILLEQQRNILLKQSQKWAQMIGQAQKNTHIPHLTEIFSRVDQRLRYVQLHRKEEENKLQVTISYLHDLLKQKELKYLSLEEKLSNSHMKSQSLEKQFHSHVKVTETLEKIITEKEQKIIYLEQQNYLKSLETQNIQQINRSNQLKISELEVEKNTQKLKQAEFQRLLSQKNVMLHEIQEKYIEEKGQHHEQKKLKQNYQQQKQTLELEKKRENQNIETLSSNIENFKQIIDNLKIEKKVKEEKVIQQIRQLEIRMTQNQQSYRKQVREKDEVIQKKEQILKETHNELNDIKGFIILCKEKIRDLTIEKDEFQKQLLSHFKTKDELTIKIQERQAEIKTLQTQLEKEKDLANSEKVFLREELNISQEKLSKQNYLLMKIKQQKAQIQNRISKVEEENISLRKHIQNLNNDSKGIQIEFQERIKNKIQQVNEGKQANKELRSQLLLMVQQNETLRLQCNNLESKFKEMSRKLEDEEKSASSHRESLTDRETENNHLKQYNIHLTQQLQQTHLKVQQIQTQLDRQNLVLSNLNQEKEKILEDNAALTQQIESTKTDLNLAQEKNLIYKLEIQQTTKKASSEIEQWKTKWKYQIQNNEKIKSDHEEEIKLKLIKIDDLKKEINKKQGEHENKIRITYEECLKKDREKKKEIEKLTRELEKLEMELKVSKEEYFNLRQIMEEQLGKRKCIIQQLIHEKKILYQQIGNTH